jgi:activating signal cointegrator complex subunit 2
MKADILRRAEAISSDEEEEIYEPDPLTSKGKGKKPSLGMDIGPDEDDEILVPLRIAGDGEDSGDEDDEDDGEEEEEAQTPETIVELAYLRDPKLLDRDAATRRSKARADLKAQTGTL